MTATEILLNKQLAEAQQKAWTLTREAWSELYEASSEYERHFVRACNKAKIHEALKVFGKATGSSFGISPTDNLVDLDVPKLPTKSAWITVRIKPYRDQDRYMAFCSCPCKVTKGLRDKHKRWVLAKPAYDEAMVLYDKLSQVRVADEAILIESKVADPTKHAELSTAVAEAINNMIGKQQEKDNDKTSSE